MRLPRWGDDGRRDGDQAVVADGQPDADAPDEDDDQSEDDGHSEPKPDGKGKRGRLLYDEHRTLTRLEVAVTCICTCDVESR
jgi:hypothetical protein